jgi:predicted porin
MCFFWQELSGACFESQLEASCTKSKLQKKIKFWILTEGENSVTSIFRKVKRSALTIVPLVAASISVVSASKAADIAPDLQLPFKAPPELPDLTWKGITFIGNIDVSAQYETNGSPYAGGIYTSNAQVVPWGRQPTFVFAPNQEAQSYWGFKIDELLWNDFHFIGRVESGFNPTTGELSNGLRTLQSMNGIPTNQQVMNGDAARAGEIFNGEAWAGFSSRTWGTVHIGRNNMLSTDMIGAYDPLASYGFSLYGWVGFLAGQGGAETPRVDESIKYQKEFGPFRISAMFGQPQNSLRQMYQGTAGVVFSNFSVDVIGGHVNDLVNGSSLSGAANLGSPFLGGRVSDTSMLGIFGKYSVNLSRPSSPDIKPPSLTFSGGYQRLDFTNPSDGGDNPGHVLDGGYQLGPVLATNGSSGSGIVNYAYTGKDRMVNMYFAAVKYQYDEKLSFATGYYRYDGSSYGLGVNGIPGIVAPAFSKTDCSSFSFINCSGTQQTASIRADYQWNKNIIFYTGMAYSSVSGGFAFSYLKFNNLDPTVGMRFTW